MREISSDHHAEHGGDDHDREDDEDNDGTATLPMTHACVKLLPPMPSRSVSSILVTTSPILPSRPGPQDFFQLYSGSGQVLCCFCS